MCNLSSSAFYNSRKILGKNVWSYEMMMGMGRCSRCLVAAAAPRIIFLPLPATCASYFFESYFLCYGIYLCFTQQQLHVTYLALAIPSCTLTYCNVSVQCSVLFFQKRQKRNKNKQTTLRRIYQYNTKRNKEQHSISCWVPRHCSYSPHYTTRGFAAQVLTNKC